MPPVQGRPAVKPLPQTGHAGEVVNLIEGNRKVEA